MPTFGLSVDTSNVQRVMAAASDSFRYPMVTEIGDGAQDAQKIYLQASRSRYLVNSGGGEWAELAPSTQRQRERLGYDPDRPILIRDATVYGALFPYATGNLFEVMSDGVRAGIGGGDIHPGYAGERSTETIGQIAYWLHNGTEKMPARPILVEPEPDTLTAMGRAVTVTVATMWARITRQFGQAANP